MKKRSKVKENSPAMWQIPRLRAEDHKYTRGHVVVLGGEVMTGAARLAALGAQRAGAGMVTVAATPASWAVYAASLLSVIARPVSVKEWRDLMMDDRVRAVVIGPGAGVNARTKAALQVAARAEKPLILDADVMTLMAQDAALRKALLPAPKILTPHEGEYTRLAKALKISVMQERVDLAVALAQRLRAVMVLKGAETVVTDGEQVCVTHPPAWLATAGTGDVLAGIIAGMVAQGMALFEAAAAGVWLHAEAARAHGHGMIAEDVVATLPAVLRCS